MRRLQFISILTILIALLEKLVHTLSFYSTSQNREKEKKKETET